MPPVLHSTDTVGRPGDDVRGARQDLLLAPGAAVWPGGACATYPPDNPLAVAVGLVALDATEATEATVAAEAAVAAVAAEATVATSTTGGAGGPAGGGLRGGAAAAVGARHTPILAGRETAATPSGDAGRARPAGQ